MKQLPQYMLTNVDLRRIDQQGKTRSSKIKSLMIPPVKLVTAAANPGGGVMERNHVMPRIEALEPKMDSFGIDPDMLDGMGEQKRWIFAAAYKQRNGAVVPARGIIEASVAEWEPDESDPTDFQTFSHTFQDVSHFEFTLDSEQLIYIDDEENELIFRGNNLTAAYNRALGI